MKLISHIPKIFLLLVLVVLPNTIQSRSYKDLKDNSKFHFSDVEHNQVEDDANDSADGRKPKKDCTAQRLCSIIGKVNSLTSQATTIDTNINVGFLNIEAELDAVKELQEEQSSKLENCCLTLNSKLNKLAKNVTHGFDNVADDLDEVLEVQEEQSSKLDDCCFSLNSKIDNLVFSPCDLSTVSSKLDVCCAQLNSSLDSIENTVENCCLTLNSKLDGLEVGTCDLTTISSKLDACCLQVNSKVDLLSLCNAIPITGKTTITSPGHYCLAQNITAAGPIINLSGGSSNVVIDLNGHTLFPSSNAGIFVTGAHNNVTIENGSIIGASSGITIFASGAGHNNIKISNVTVQGTTATAINVNTVKDFILENCFLQNNNTNLNLSQVDNAQILNVQCTSALTLGAQIQNCNNVHINCCQFNQNFASGMAASNSNSLYIEKSQFNNNGGVSANGLTVIECSNIRILDCSFSKSAGTSPISNQLFGLFAQGTRNLNCENCLFNGNNFTGAQVEGFPVTSHCAKFVNCQANGNGTNGLSVFNNVSDVIFDSCFTCSNSRGFNIEGQTTNVPTNICILNSVSKANSSTGFRLSSGTGLLKENQALGNGVCGFDDFVFTTSQYKYVANVGAGNGANPASILGFPFLDTNYCISSFGSIFIPNGPGIFPYRQVNLDTPPNSYWNNITLP